MPAGGTAHAEKTQGAREEETCIVAPHGRHSIAGGLQDAETRGFEPAALAYITQVEPETTGALPSTWASLLVRCREGDDVAFEMLVAACERRVLGIAYQMTGNLEDAQDVAQESFLRLYRSRDRFQEGRSFEAWLYRIVVNQSKRALARRRRRASTPIDEVPPEELPGPGGESPSEAVAATELSETITRLLEELSPRLRAVFVLRDLHGMSTSEIAAILSCTETTVRRHSADARHRIRVLLVRRHPGLLDGRRPPE